MNNIDKLSALICIKLNAQEKSTLSKDVAAIMDYVEKLQSCDTTGIAPLFHPFDLHQRVREDLVTEQDCVQQLKEIAPLFEDGLYWVPKVIEDGN